MNRTVSDIFQCAGSLLQISSWSFVHFGSDSNMDIFDHFLGHKLKRVNVVVTESLSAIHAVHSSAKNICPVTLLAPTFTLKAFKL